MGDAFYGLMAQMPNLVLLVCTLLIQLQHGTAATDKMQIDPATGSWTDTHGRVRVFHGVNVVYKESPWLPSNDTFDTQNSLVAEDMQRLQDWGFNVVRLGVMWPGLEPTAGQYNADGYLERVEAVIEQLSGYGVYTIADLHQDLLGRHFCGEGIPEFYVDDLLANASSAVAQAALFPLPAFSPLALNSSGYPSLEDCLAKPFTNYYRADRVGALFRELYTPGSPINKGFVQFWRVMANKFGGRVSGLLGYELLNEPSGQCLKRNTSRGWLDCTSVSMELGSNAPEELSMAPLWRAAAAAIRERDVDRPIMYEADPSPMLAAPPFDEPVLGSDTQQVLAYHIYCEPGDGANLAARVECLAAQTLFADEYYGFLKQHHGVGGFMTEFGAVGTSAGELEHLNRLLQISYSHFQSWAYWQLKKYKDFTTMNAAESLYWPNGTIEQSKLSTLSRTFAQAIAGTPVSMVFDRITCGFELVYKATISTAPTEVYLNEALHYPHGVDVNVDLSSRDAGCAQIERLKNRVHVTIAAHCIGQVVAIRLAPKTP